MHVSVIPTWRDISDMFTTSLLLDQSASSPYDICWDSSSIYGFAWNAMMMIFKIQETNVCEEQP